MSQYSTEPVEGSRTKHYVVRIADGERVAILEDRDHSETARGWYAWTLDGEQVLSGRYAGGTLDYVLRVAAEWL